MCFEQRLCDTFIDSSRGVFNIVDQPYSHKVKRNQQVKNSSLDIAFVSDLLNEIDYFELMDYNLRVRLISDIMGLWDIFVNLSGERSTYIHRKDKRCFVVAIMFAIPTGLSCLGGVVVCRHPFVKIKRLNKKRDYKAFKVSDIRDGQKMIKLVFDKHVIEKPLTICHE